MRRRILAALALGFLPFTACRSYRAISEAPTPGHYYVLEHRHHGLFGRQVPQGLYGGLIEYRVAEDGTFVRVERKEVGK